MNKPIGATQKQLEENNIEWVYRPDYSHRNVHEAIWELRHSSEYEWAKEQTKLMQEIANLKREKKHTEQQIKILYANSSSEYHKLRLSRIINEFNDSKEKD